MAEKKKVLRNEVQILIGGKERTLRASFDALQGIESRLGNLMTVIDTVTRGDIGVIQCATVIYYGLIGNKDTRGFGEKDEGLTLQGVGAEVLKMGVTKAMKPVTEFLLICMSGVEVPLDEAPAE